MVNDGEVLRAGEYVLAVEGLAMIRSIVVHPSAARARVHEIQTILEHFDEFPHSLEFPVTEHSVEAGYSLWAPNYDGPNPAIEREEPVVRRVLSDIAPGTGLDAACGTGRHASILAERGNKVIGVDATEGMLAIARQKLPSADLRQGRLEALPVDDASVDVLTCGLALEHVPDLLPVFAEFARVLRPGGQAVISDMHPVWRTTGGVAGFPTGDGRRGVPFVTGFTHQMSEYIGAFLSARFNLRACIELAVEEETLHIFPSMRTYPEATRQAFLGLPFVVVWHLER